jgi:hypothetical protein
MNIVKMTAVAFSISLACSAGAMAQALSQDEYKAITDRISSDYAVGKKACDALAGNAKDICVAKVVGRERVANAELDARQEPTAENLREAAIVRAEAASAVAREKCDALAGNTKDVCLKEAEADEVRAKADAKAVYRISSANETAHDKAAEAAKDARQEGVEARQEAASDKRDANLSLAKEKCDALSGDAKDTCLEAAKIKYAQ